jgi:hypothetical protein
MQGYIHVLRDIFPMKEDPRPITIGGVAPVLLWRRVLPHVALWTTQLQCVES